jgi:hypothetical protein
MRVRKRGNVSSGGPHARWGGPRLSHRKAVLGPDLPIRPCGGIRCAWNPAVADRGHDGQAPARFGVGVCLPGHGVMRALDPEAQAQATAGGGVSPGQRRRTGIEPACDAERRTPVLKTGGATRHPDASGTDLTGAGPGAEGAGNSSGELAADSAARGLGHAPDLLERVGAPAGYPDQAGLRKLEAVEEAAHRLQAAQRGVALSSPADSCPGTQFSCRRPGP